MIHPGAVKQFLRQPTDRSSWLKKVPIKKIRAKLERVGFEERNRSKPLRDHQVVCSYLGIKNPRYCFWLDMGTGKTRLSLELLNFWFIRFVIKKAIVFCPNETSANQWQAQMKEWNIAIPSKVLTMSSSKTKWRGLQKMKTGIIFMVPAGAIWMVCEKKLTKKGKVKMKLNRRLMKLFGKDIDAMVVDESTVAMHKQALFSRMCNYLSKHVKVCYALAGRPFGRDLTNLWMQYFIVDRGATLGPTLGMFRAAYFTEKKNFWGGYTYTFRPEAEKHFRRRLEHRSITYEESECGQLPKLVQTVEKVPMDTITEDYLLRLMDVAQSAKGDKVKTHNVFIRMRQLSSGYVTVGEKGARSIVNISKPPKLEHLLAKVRQVPKNRKFVIFHEFIHSGHMIEAALRKEGIKHVWISGKTKNKAKLIKKFNNDPTVQGLIISNRLGSLSLNLQAANYMFVYEQPVAVIDWAQLRKRCWRMGQIRTVFLYIFAMEGTADISIIKFHKEGEELFSALMRNPMLMFGGSNVKGTSNLPSGKGKMGPAKQGRKVGSAQTTHHREAASSVRRHREMRNHAPRQASASHRRGRAA